jgi:hypothetical protein
VKQCILLSTADTILAWVYNQGNRKVRDEADPFYQIFVSRVASQLLLSSKPRSHHYVDNQQLLAEAQSDTKSPQKARVNLQIREHDPLVPPGSCWVRSRDFEESILASPKGSILNDLAIAVAGY